jgi:hypothetical protein
VFAKLAVVIVAAGAIGCALLALRQQRYQMASELTVAQLRINALDERLWQLRADVAKRVTPREVEKLVNTLGPLRPMVDAVPSAEGDEWIMPGMDPTGRFPVSLLPRKRVTQPEGVPR